MPGILYNIMEGKSKLSTTIFVPIHFKQLNKRNSNNKEGIMQSNVKQIKNNI